MIKVTDNQIIKEYFLSENILKSTLTKCDEPYQNGEFDTTPEEQKEYTRHYDFIQKLIKQKKIVIHYVHKLPETFDKENDIYILNSKDYKSSYGSRDFLKDPSTNECFNHFLIYLDEIVDETFAHFKYGESFESSGYKTKSEWKKDIQTHKDLCLGNYKCRNQKYASDIEQWVEIGCFPKKELTMFNAPRGTKLWTVWKEFQQKEAI